MSKLTRVLKNAVYVGLLLIGVATVILVRVATGEIGLPVVLLVIACTLYGAGWLLAWRGATAR